MPDERGGLAECDPGRPPRVDALAGGPVVYPAGIREELVRLCDTGVPTCQVYRAFDEMLTGRMVRDELPGYWTEIERSGVDVLSMSIGAWGDPMFGLDAALFGLDQWDRRFREVPRLLKIEQPGDLRTAAKNGRTGVPLGFQNSDQFEGDLGNVARLADRGVRMVQLTYNGRNAAGCGCTEPADEGLTGFGRDLVHELNQSGVVIDVSHCGSRTSMQAVELSAAPVAVSHAGCAALCGHDRNKSDDLLRLFGERRGFFGVCAVPFFLRRDRPASVSDIVRHVVHTAEVAGKQTVGIGTDWGVPDTPSQLLTRLQDSAASQGFQRRHRFRFAAQTTGFESWSKGWPRLASEVHDQLGPEMADHVLGGNFAALFHRVARP